MTTILYQNYSSPYGKLILGTFEDKLCLCDWRYRKMRSTIDARIAKGLKAEYKEGNSAVIAETTQQLEQYFSGSRTAFDVPLLMVGTDFQKQVWRELIKVEYGETVHYQELANRIGNPDSVRAVASANGANAISIIVPCHRVIGKDGSLTGYAGGLPAKQSLLMLESNRSLF